MEKKTLMEKLIRYTKVMRFSVSVLSACITLRNFFPLKVRGTCMKN